VNDVIARQFGERMAATLGQSFVVENRGGAGGTIGIAEMARSAGDGSTLPRRHQPADAEPAHHESGL
jgi:tripartite-type tricarboxylate transporter receptor subunit TctC